MSYKKNRSYLEILRSTGIIGGAQVINIAIGIIRNKLTAIILGSEGIGLISIYQSTTDLIKSISTLGIETSGVREIALAKDNPEDLVITISAIRRWIVILAFIGSTICLLSSPLISSWIFDTTQFTGYVALLSICVFFSILSAGEVVILQGIRQLPYLVKASMLWNVSGLCLAIAFYLIWGVESIVPVFVVSSIVTYLWYIYYRNKLNINRTVLRKGILIAKGKKMLRIGAYIVIAAIQTELTLFIVKTYIINKSGLDDLGLVQATRTISSVYLTLILGAMAADFYPRLSNIINNNTKVRRLINEQVYILILISTPVILILLMLSKLLLQLFYATSFESATSLLNWRLLALFFKIVSWALGFTLLAKGKGLLFLLTDTIFSMVYLICCFFFFSSMGIESIGVAFLVGYIVYLLSVYFATKSVVTFRWKRNNIICGFISTFALFTMFYICQYQRQYLIYLGFPISILSISFSIYKLNHIIPISTILNKIVSNKKSDL